MLYALILVISTTSRIQQFTPAPDWPVQVGSSYVATVNSQQVIAYYETERACLSAARRPNASWPPRTAGQSVRPMCVPVEAVGELQPPPLQGPSTWSGPAWPGAWWQNSWIRAPWWGGGW